MMQDEPYGPLARSVASIELVFAQVKVLERSISGCFEPRDNVHLPVSGGTDSRILDHQDHRAAGRSRPVQHALRHYKSLAGREFDRPPFQVDQQLAFNNI